MLKLTLTSALIGATLAQTTVNMCPKAICTGTATAVAKVVVKAATKYKCAEVTKAAKPAGCTDAVPTADFAAATCTSDAGTGKSTVLTPAVAADVCAFVKTGCNWVCPAGCDTTKISGKYMDGYVKGVTEQKDVACTLANAALHVECKGYAAPTCKGVSTAKIFDTTKAGSTCASTLAICANVVSEAGCAAATGCKFTAATYTAVAGAGAEKFTIPLVTAKPGTSTDCTAAIILAGKDTLKTCTSTVACTGTATNKGKMKGGGSATAAGTTMTTCAVSPFETSAAKCDAGCTFTAMKAGKYTGKSTADDPTTAVTAADGYQPICSTSCMSQRFQPTIRTTYTNVGCAPGCTMTAPVPVVPVAPSPAKSSSASAATMAAATIALSAIAAIVAL